VSQKTGRVSVRSLRLRSGPGRDRATIRSLPRGTELTVLKELDNWLKVSVGKTTGFVYKTYVDTVGAASVPRFLMEQADIQKVDLAPAELLQEPDVTRPRDRLLRRTWNGFGGLLQLLSKKLNIEPAVAIAVLCVESSGKGFGPDGKMIIRFENHVFWRYWGKSHPDVFHDHFAFDEKRPWCGHRFRNSIKERWKSVHGKGQTSEWKVFEFARATHPRFSMYSISMGMPQIMGFNHRRIGCESVEQMFVSFERSERNQIIGLFDFIAAGRLTSGKESKLAVALKKRDFPTFARLYNGSGQAEDYSRLIEGYHESFEELMRQKSS